MTLTHNMNKLILALGILLFSAIPAFANTCTYTGAGGANASDATNWSGCGGVAPTTSDIVIFDGAFPVTGNDNCTWDITAAIASINTTGYSGLITASVTMTVSGNVTFANSTFAHGNQNFIFNATSTINPGTAGNSFYDVDFSEGFIFTISNNMTVAHDAILINSVSTTNFDGNKKILVAGNVTATSGRASGNGSASLDCDIEMNGTGAQTYTGNTSYVNVPGTLIINKASGTLTFSGGLIPYNGITHQAGAVDFTTNTVATYLKDQSLSYTITSNSSITFYDFGLGDSRTLTLADNMTIAHTLDIGAGSVGTSTINGNTILLSGDFINTGGNQVNGTFNLTFTGSGAQTWSATNTTYVIGGGTMTVNKSGSALTVSGAVRWDGNFTHTAGSVTTTSSTVRFVGSKNVNSGSIVWNVFQTYSSGTITLTGNLNTADLTIDSGTTLSAGSNTITITGNFAKTGTFTAGTSTVIFNGTTTCSVNGIAFYNMTINSGKTVHLTSTKTYSTNAAGTFTATGCTLDAVTASSAAVLTVSGTQSVSGVTATDIDSSAGNTVHNPTGTNTRTTNWDTVAAPTGAGNFLIFF